MAGRGIPKTTYVASSCALLKAAAWLISSMAVASFALMPQKQYTEVILAQVASLAEPHVELLFPGPDQHQRQLFRGQPEETCVPFF